MSDLPMAADHLLRIEQARGARASDKSELKERVKSVAKADFQKFFLRRVELVIESETPFIERLVHFWSNHFAISRRKKNLGPMAAAFEFEVIRPNVLGSFSQMLLAAESHPAMLLYLDNTKSTGANSMLAKSYKSGGKKHFGINENLAREILELHTMGVRSGYVQKDIVELSMALTGWSVESMRGPFAGDSAGNFQYINEMHEPGERFFLSKRYPESGLEQADLMLQDLAIHPATARYLATKLCRYFVADVPPTELVDSVANAYMASDGHLGETCLALLMQDIAWQGPLTKWKSHEEFIYSSLRSLEVREINSRDLTNTLTSMGQPPYEPPSPAGWPEDASSFVTGAGVLRRIEFAHHLSRGINISSPVEFYQQAYGPLAGEQAMTEISRAESIQQGISLFLMSPEFQRR
jgi:uncharacterized protein (DUF1800 family)